VPASVVPSTKSGRLGGKGGERFDDEQNEPKKLERSGPENWNGWNDGG
jgi:hypothetical protein